MFHLISGLVMGFVAFYVYARCVGPLPLSGVWKAFLGVLLALAAFKLLWFRALFGGPAQDLPRWLLALSGGVHIGLVVLALLVLTYDLSRLLWSLWCRVGLGTGVFLWDEAPVRRAALLTLGACLLTTLGVWNALRVPGVRQVEMVLPRLPQALDGLRLVQLADLHASEAFPRSWVRAVVERTNALRPDLILITGDLVDGSPASRWADVAPLADLRARYGVFACLGNHEYYAGLDDWAPVFEKLGLNVLRNAHRVLWVNGAPLALAGVTDEVGERYGLPGPDPELALRGAPGEALRVLMAHRPGGARENARHGVDLQLSGHTHGGQLFPVDRLVGWLNDGFRAGAYAVGDMALYVSRGAGLWGGFPVRLPVPAEITEITLRRGTPPDGAPSSGR